MLYNLNYEKIISQNNWVEMYKNVNIFFSGGGKTGDFKLIFIYFCCMSTFYTISILILLL